MKLVRGPLYARCPDCGKYVRVMGWFAGWHLCVPEEERR